MTLSEYLKATGQTAAAFARKINESPLNVLRYVNGSRRPRSATLLKIHVATCGMVSANDFYLSGVSTGASLPTQCVSPVKEEFRSPGEINKSDPENPLQSKPKKEVESNDKAS